MYISFKPYCLLTRQMYPQKFIYVLLRLAEKPAVKFLKSAIYQKKYDLGVYQLTTSINELVCNTLAWS